MDAVYVFATIRPKPGQDEAVRELFGGMVAASRGEPGNQVYDLYASDGDDGAVFHVFERYLDAAALESHRRSEHYSAYSGRAGEMLTGPPEVVVLRPVDVA